MLLVISVLFFVAGLCLVIKNPQTSNRFIDNELFKTVIFYGAILMGAIGIYFFGKRLFDKKPPLILNEDGIYESISIYRLGFTPWADITDIGENSVRSSVGSKQYFINIKLQHPDKYISSQSYLTKKLLQYNTKSSGYTLQISTNELKVKHDELMNIFSTYFNRYKICR